jgi:Uncharacterized conserved protein (COG2071)
MRIPTISGIIDRRILINYTVDPEIVRRVLPEPFKPKVYLNKAIAGICLIRLTNIRPKGFPVLMGISSENGAHRIAVEWSEGGTLKEGVFVPRRDTSSLINTIAGGRVFPGKHYHAKFEVQEGGDSYQIAFKSSDGTTISIDAVKAIALNTSSIFGDIKTASGFFENGSVGYSPNGNKYDGIELRAFNWKVEPLAVKHVHSSFFEDENAFPKGTVQFDNALLMTQINHEWHSVKPKSKCL